MPAPEREATPQLSAHTLSWLASRPPARHVVNSVWTTLAEVNDVPRLRAALQFVLIHHQPTAAGRCHACRRTSWRALWRRRRFPCVVWHQIRGELLGHFTLFTLSGVHRRRTENSRSTP